MVSHEEFDDSDHLEVVREARSAAAERLKMPGWFHPLVGLGAGAFTVAFGLGGWGVRIPAMVLFIAGAILLVMWRQRVTGLAVTVQTGGRADHWAGVAAFSAMIGVIAAATVARFTDLDGVVVLIGLGVAVIVTASSPRVGQALRDEVRDGPIAR
ncbi:hypothetical protein [Kribbella italica]|uniref:Uncharacterized protein n=1 Tax=Kribbella italica TaxID=1540520 RepID=A0A7W9J0C0_9ACTN|nr:hypothetical protein [Kribbella italica]MBB5833299.1 hypothetical protein [Kribbella italica]